MDIKETLANGGPESGSQYSLMDFNVKFVYSKPRSLYSFWSVSTRKKYITGQNLGWANPTDCTNFKQNVFHMLRFVFEIRVNMCV